MNDKRPIVMSSIGMTGDRGMGFRDYKILFTSKE